MKNTDTDL